MERRESRRGKEGKKQYMGGQKRGREINEGEGGEKLKRKEKEIQEWNGIE